jgi:hypothetical protein
MKNAKVEECIVNIKPKNSQLMQRSRWQSCVQCIQKPFHTL